MARPTIITEIEFGRIHYIKMAKPIVSNITTEDLTPVIPGFEKYLPKVLFSEQYSFDLDNVNNAIANGIRRVLCNELPGLALWFETDNLSTDNPFSIANMIQNRIRLIPINQSVSSDAVFELNAVNNTADVRMVYSDEIRQKLGPTMKKLCNNFPLFTLEPNKFLNIDRIVIRQDYGYNFDGHSLACNVTSLALDQAPPLEFVGEPPTFEPEFPSADSRFEIIEAGAERVPSRLSNPKKFRISFITNGVAKGEKLVAMACDELIGKMNAVVAHIDGAIEREGLLYVLTMTGYSHTTGNLLVRTIIDLYPNATATYSVESMARVLRVRIRTDDNIGDVLQRVTAEIISKYKIIKAAFKSD